MSRISKRTLAILAVMSACALAVTPSARGQQPTPSPPSGSSIIPKREPLVPRPFTLELRYLDAARRGDLAMLELSLEKGADLHAKDVFSRSALLLAARDGHSLEMVRSLQSRGLALDEPDVRGIAALGYAAGNGQLDLVLYLIEQGVLVDRKDTQGLTPLFHATLSGKKETVARLLKSTVDVNVQDRFGDTPLMGACAKGHDDIARLLVSAGADTSLVDQEGRTAAKRATAGAEYCRTLSANPTKD